VETTNIVQAGKQEPHIKLKPRSLIWVYQTKRNPKTKRIMGPVATGLRRQGHRVEIRESSKYESGTSLQPDYIAAWGDWFGVEDILRDVGLYGWGLLHIDNGYYARSSHTVGYKQSYDGYYSVTLNNRQCHEYLWDGDTPSPDRFLTQEQSPHRWRKPSAPENSIIYLLGFSSKQAKLFGLDHIAWLQATKAWLQPRTTRRILVRPKNYDDLNFRQVLRDENIHLVVGYHTKALVESLLEGVPIVSLAPCVVNLMGGSKNEHELLNNPPIDDPIKPNNRLDFFSRLAWHQWTLGEIAAGLMWA